MPLTNAERAHHPRWLRLQVPSGLQRPPLGRILSLADPLDLGSPPLPLPFLSSPPALDLTLGCGGPAPKPVGLAAASVAVKAVPMSLTNATMSLEM